MIQFSLLRHKNNINLVKSLEEFFHKLFNFVYFPQLYKSVAISSMHQSLQFQMQEISRRKSAL